MEAQKTKKYANPYLFEYLNNILVKKDWDLYERHIHDETFNSFPCFQCIRYLSMCEDKDVRNALLKKQLLIERLDKIDHKFSYGWFLRNIPKQKSGFIRYIK